MMESEAGKIVSISFIGDAVISAIILLLAFSSLFIILKEKFVESSKHNFISIMVYVLAGIMMLNLKHSLISSIILYHAGIYEMGLFFVPLMITIFIFLILSAIFIYNEKNFAFNLFSILLYDFYFVFSMFYSNYWNDPFRLLHSLIPIILSSTVILYYLISRAEQAKMNKNINLFH